jgi:hypothetical protein
MKRTRSESYINNENNENNENSKKLKLEPVFDNLKMQTKNNLQLLRSIVVEETHSKYFKVPMQNTQFIELYDYLQKYYYDEDTDKTGLGPCIDAQFVPDQQLLLYRNTENTIFGIPIECNEDDICTLTNRTTGQTYVIQKGAGKRKRRNITKRKRRNITKRKRKRDKKFGNILSNLKNLISRPIK